MEASFVMPTQSAALRTAINETERRRAAQEAHNTAHGITPQSAHRRDTAEAFKEQLANRQQAAEEGPHYDSTDVSELKALMLAAAEDLSSEAARLRDQLKALEAGEAAPDTSEKTNQSEEKGRRKSATRYNES